MSERDGSGVSAEQKKGEIRLSKPRQVLFSIAIFAVFIILLEVGLRLLGYPPSLRYDSGLAFEIDNALGYEYTPGWRGYHAGRLVSINADGWRGSDLAKAKQPGTFRILGIGDSFTFGTALDQDEVFLAQLETMLNETGAAFEVINTGREDSNTFQQLRYLNERRLLDMDPDLVVLGFTIHNDAQLSTQRHVRALRNRLRETSYLLDFTEGRMMRHLSGRSRAAHAIQTGARWLYSTHVDRVAYDLIMSNYREGTETWEVCRESLLGILDACNERNVPLAVVLFPIFPGNQNLTFSDYPERSRELHRRLASVFEGRPGVTVIDIVGDLAATGLTVRDLRVPIDGHPNRAYFEVVARRLRDEVLRLKAGNGTNALDDQSTPL